MRRPQPSFSLSNPMQPHIHSHPLLMMIRPARCKMPAQALPQRHLCNDLCVFHSDGIQIRPLEREKKDLWVRIIKDVLEAEDEHALAIRHQCRPDKLLPISLHTRCKTRKGLGWSLGEDSVGNEASET